MSRSYHAVSGVRFGPRKLSELHQQARCKRFPPRISGFTTMLKHYQEHAPLKRSLINELGQTGVFLATPVPAITGQVIYVDGGYQIRECSGKVFAF
jgi:hypothetical protein